MIGVKNHFVCKKAINSQFSILKHDLGKPIALELQGVFRYKFAVCESLLCPHPIPLPEGEGTLAGVFSEFP